MTPYLVPATEPAHVADARRLIQAYGATRPGDPALTGLSAEIAGLPGEYAAEAGGALWLAYLGDEPVGCVALRQIDERTCEMKRLFVLPTHRGHGTGWQLAEQIIAVAWAMGYERMRLDSLPSMQKAQALYEHLGFYEIAPYRFNPNPGVRFFELTR